MRLLIIILALFSAEATASELDGKGFRVEGLIRVINGDTIIVGHETVRLHGIDALEKAQICQIDGLDWACGLTASDTMEAMFGNLYISCLGKKRGRWSHLIAVCKVGKPEAAFQDIGKTMVEIGLAMAYREYSTDYVDAENKAKADKEGMWRGEFVPPWEWRERTMIEQ
jgi:endonuclease YncB( thermonuclease family)